jgi:hypothetical protein
MSEYEGSVKGIKTAAWLEVKERWVFTLEHINCRDIAI